MDKKVYQYKEVIFKENIYQRYMYSICEGTVDIYSGYETPDEKKLVTLTAGQFFGEIGMIGMMPRTATAVAAEDHVVLEQIDLDNFGDYLKKHPENLQPIMSSVSRRIRELTEDLSVITQMTNEALRKKENGTVTSGWLVGSVKKMLDKLKAKRSSSDEFAIMHKRQLALSEKIPPVLKYNAGNVIFRAGDHADCMYDIYDGVVGIYSGYQTENEKLLRKLYTDDVFGEMGILDDLPRSATAVCLNDCALLVVSQENFMRFFQDKPTKVLQILQKMCIQLRDLTKTYIEVSKALEEMPPLEEEHIRQDEVLAELEYIHQKHLYSSMYDVTGCSDWIYDCL